MDISVVLLAVVVVVVLVFIGVMIFRGASNDGKSQEKRPRGAASGDGKQRRAGPKVNWLVGRTAEVEDKSFHIGGRTATVGRGLGNFIQVGDENCSKVHAQLVGSPAGMRIKDMGSSNGTRVNGEELEADTPRRLINGDEIALGDTVFVYYASGDFRDDALTAKRSIEASQQKKTQALGAIGGGAGDFKEQIAAAVIEADGDYDKVAKQFDLDVDLLKKIVGASQEA